MWLRFASIVASVPGVPTAAALVYWAQTGVYLGPDLVNVLSYATHVQVPVLLISGGSDWVVPTEHERRVLAAFPVERKSLVVIPGAQHDTTYSTNPKLYQDVVLRFLDEDLPHQTSR